MCRYSGGVVQTGGRKLFSGQVCRKTNFRSAVRRRQIHLAKIIKIRIASVEDAILIYRDSPTNPNLQIIEEGSQILPTVANVPGVVLKAAISVYNAVNVPV